MIVVFTLLLCSGGYYNLLTCFVNFLISLHCFWCLLLNICFCIIRGKGCYQTKVKFLASKSSLYFASYLNYSMILAAVFKVLFFKKFKIHLTVQMFGAEKHIWPRVACALVSAVLTRDTVYILTSIRWISSYQEILQDGNQWAGWEIQDATYQNNPLVPKN